MVELVVKHTNTKIQNVQDNLPDYYRLGKSTFIRPLNHQEFYAFVSLLYAVFLASQWIMSECFFLKLVSKTLFLVQ